MLISNILRCWWPGAWHPPFLPSSFPPFLPASLPACLPPSLPKLNHACCCKVSMFQSLFFTTCLKFMGCDKYSNNHTNAHSLINWVSAGEGKEHSSERAWNNRGFWGYRQDLLGKWCLSYITKCERGGVFEAGEFCVIREACDFKKRVAAV